VRTTGPQIKERQIPPAVYDGYFADPFAWEYKGEYFAIGTGPAEAAGETAGTEKVFPLLHSRDFIHWRYAGQAMERPDPEMGNTFWAPEVAFAEGRFYLYYSVGRGDKFHQLGVAISEHPLGPYHDVGLTFLAPRANTVGLRRNPTTYPFAIDPHPFRDVDGTWYLFYARDFLDSENGLRAGTALAVDRLRTMTELAVEEKVVLRARYDWQRFQNPRRIYGQTFDWHTLEGPFVRRHNGRYYCLYSGGRWETENYGVDYGVADSVWGPYSDAGAENGPRVLRTVPGQLLGPGHNSIVTRRDGQDYIVYHAWDRTMKARRMYVNRLTWTRNGLRLAD
jgi:beta-xylosidase